MRRILLVAALTVLPFVAGAECALPVLVAPEVSVPEGPPVAPDPGLRPSLPGCLSGLASPNQESCSDAEIAGYAAAVEAYDAALQAYVTAADRFANASVEAANAAVARAEAARAYADEVFAFATCEAEAVRAQK